MKDNNRKVKIGNQIATVLATVVILLSIFWSAVLYRRMDFRVYENEIRVLAEEQNKEIEQGVYEQWEYPYLVCNLTGLVLYADEEFQKQEGEWVNVQEILRMDESFGKNYQLRGRALGVYLLQADKPAEGFGDLTGERISCGKGMPGG